MAWVREHRHPSIFALLVAIQVVLIVAMVIREERFQRGTNIVLEAQPVDPRDPLRGDFVILGYRAQNLDGVAVPQSGFIEREDVYVVLADRGRYWEAVGIRSDNIDSAERDEGLLAIRARVVNESPLRVEFPDLGEYFLEQGTGRLPDTPDVHVSVSEDGTARILYLAIDGQRWPFDVGDR
jgi:uncharacterized membrane-anchored protein